MFGLLGSEQSPIPLPASTTMKSVISTAKYCKRLENPIIHANVEVIIAGRLNTATRGKALSLETPVLLSEDVPFIISSLAHVSYRGGSEV